ncbi:D-2-hydroxyacid dehydrogenase [Brochothrix thermosphacta]|uniref:D-2-hydroxyacid dehydrogenase n=1 Tax=Brochothrix thermosphacta TaxID=2756 RepID=UPI003F944B9F
MKMVILDGYGLNPGDISWAPLETLGEISVYDRTPENDTALIIERIGDARIIFTNKVPITQEVMLACPQLEYIGVLATGYNVVDIEAAKEKHIVVTNVPSYGTDAVAQFTFALLLEIASQVGLHNRSVQAGDWQNSPDFTYWKQPLFELAGKTLGLVGYGLIAQKVAEIAVVFGMNVIYYNHRPKQSKTPSVKQVTLDEVYHKADIISLHVPQMSETTQMINNEAIQQMKDGVILINTARGGLLDEEAVAAALNIGKIAALGADVVTKEPILATNPLLTAKNCYLTPHIAWAPVEARERLLGIAVDNVKKFLEGTPQNNVAN